MTERRPMGRRLRAMGRPNGGRAMKLVWTPEMATGIASIDAEHRAMVIAHNDLSELLDRECGAGEVAAVLECLLGLAQAHFRHEEDVMRRTDFPELARHEAEHDRIIAEFYNARHRLLGGVARTVDPEALRQFQHWFTDHVAEMDFNYVAHFRDHGVE
jgi:hemerythrin-like metal-binding protein